MIMDSEKRREIWKQRELNNLCIYCGKNNPKEKCKGCVDCLLKKIKTTKKFSKNNTEKHKQYTLLVKHQVIEKYGGECKCCGEKEILFLTIDHINNDGKLERAENHKSSYGLYLKLRREEIREDLQILCFNCNLGKSMNGGVCPHVKIIRKLDPIYDNRHIPQFDMRLKINWPDDDELVNLCNETSISQVAKNLNVDFGSVSGRLKRRGLYEIVSKKTGGTFKGEKNPSSKLTKEQVLILRKEYETGKISRSELSIKYNVSKSLIDKIVNKQVWKDI